MSILPHMLASNIPQRAKLMSSLTTAVALIAYYAMPIYA